MKDDPFAPDGPGRRDRSRDRARKQGLPKEVLAIAAGIAAVALVLVLWVLLSSSPEAQLASRARDFAKDWTDTPYEVLTKTWLDPNMMGGKKKQLRDILLRRGWLEKRPALTFDRSETNDTRDSGRSEYAVEGFPPERRLKVYWLRVQREWYLTNIRIPVEREE